MPGWPQRHQTLAVITNYLRPENVSQIIGILKAQPCDIVLADNSPDKGPLRPGFEAGAVRDVFRWQINSGPPCRFAPALMLPEYKYVLFIDDDLLPGERCIELCEQAAKDLADRFATIGEMGRRFLPTQDGIAYDPTNITGRDKRIRVVDATVRMHFCVRKWVSHAIRMRDALIGRVSADALWHDDLLLCQGIQAAEKVPSYVLRRWGAEGSLIEKNMPMYQERFQAMSEKSSHVPTRTELLRSMQKLGWKSLYRGESG